MPGRCPPARAYVPGRERCRCSPSQVLRLRAGARGARRGRGSQEAAAAENLPVALENSRKKSSSLGSPGLRCQRCLGPRQPAQPAPQTAAGGGPGGMEPEGASPAARYVSRHRAQHRLWSACVHPHPSNNWHCRSPGFLNAPQTGEQRAQHAGRGTDTPGMVSSSNTASTGWWRSQGVLVRETRWCESPKPLAAFLKTHLDSPGASVFPGAVSAHPLWGLGADGSATFPG